MLLSTTEWGDPAGKPIVCLHGVTGHGRRFRRLAEEHLQSYRVIGVDYRGHGRSGWEPPWSVEQHVADLVETTDALGVADAAWIGHSFGGKLVAEVAARHPDRVVCAVLLDPAMQLDAAVSGERADMTRTDVSFGSADEAIDVRLSDGSLFTTPRETLEEEAREHLVEGPDGRLRWQYAPACVIVASSEMAATTPPWPCCPTLVVCGERSWIPVAVPVRNGQLTRVDVPGGHSVLWDDFDATADAIVQFLA
jgi:lipase